MVLTLLVVHNYDIVIFDPFLGYARILMD